MALFTDYIAGFFRLVLFFFTLTGGSPEGFAQPVLDTDFENINFNPRVEASPNLVSEIMQDDQGYLWVGCQNGLYKYDGSNLTSYAPGADTGTLSSSNITALYEDWDGRMWIGNGNNGVDLYDRVHDRFLRNFDPLRNDLRIWDFYQPDSTTLWIGAKEFLIRYDLENNTCEYFDLPVYNVQHNAVRSIIPDMENAAKLWLGTVFGLSSFDTRSGQFSNYAMPGEFLRPEGEQGSYLLMDLIQVDPKNIWASSWGGGMVRYNLTSGKWTSYHDLPEHTDPKRWVHVVLHASRKSDNEFWVATSHGFGVFNKQSKAYSIVSEGSTPRLQHSFNYNGVCETSDGRIVVGRYGGVSISGPVTHVTNPTGYYPEIYSIKVDGREYRSDTATSHLGFIEIDQDEQDVAFTIGTPGTFHGNDPVYNYRLEGYDREWQQAASGQFRYTNLGPGSYTLNIRTSLNGNNWNYGKSTLRIRKAGYFWQYPSFYMLCAALLLLIVGIIYWINIRSIKQTAKIRYDYDRKIAGIEMAALRAQMNPHFMFNSLNSIKAYILKEKTEEASAYLTKFSKLMRAVLRNSKSQLVSLKDEFNALKLYVELESLRFKDEFKYDFTIEPGIDTNDIVMPPLLVQPYVENAIRHGLLEKEEGPKHLLIKVEKAGNDEILIIVQDNGVGRKAASKKRPINQSENRSYGMEITGDRIALIEQTLGIHADAKIVDLYNDTGMPEGTRVELRVPLIPSSEVLT